MHHKIHQNIEDQNIKNQNIIKTVAILGTGAVGSYFVWGLQKKLGENLWVVATGERKTRLETEGISINGVDYQLHVHTPREAKGVDLLIVATKYAALVDILDDIAEIVEEHTIVLSPLNGVDSEEVIGARIGMEKMVWSNIKIASQRVGRTIRFIPEITLGLTFGEAESGKTKSHRAKSGESSGVKIRTDEAKSGESSGVKITNCEAEPSPRMRAIGELFDGTPLRYQMSGDIMTDIWYKFVFNVSRNLPQAILGCGVGAYDDSENVKHLMRCLRDEVAAIAGARGIDIRELSSLEKRRGVSAPYARYSTLQDLDAGRHTEIDMFSGTVIRMGKEYGIPTPYNEFVYYAIKALEEKNDGAFAYEFPSEL